MVDVLAWVDTVFLLGVIAGWIYLMVAAWDKSLPTISLNGDGGVTSWAISAGLVYVGWMFWRAVFGECKMMMPSFSLERGAMASECTKGPLTDVLYGQGKSALAGLVSSHKMHDVNQHRMKVYAAAAETLRKANVQKPAPVPQPQPQAHAHSEVSSVVSDASSASSASSASNGFVNAVKEYYAQ